MKIDLFGPAKPADAPTRAAHPTCSTFKWVGQSWQSCEGCARPLDEHPYHPPYGSARPLFYVREHDRFRGWYWAPVGSFVRKAAS